jgi:peptidoglycan/LPS O-acetylase OafA/YrhL
MTKVSRLAFLDLMRAFAAQMIVWHHLAYYGPLSDLAYSVAAGAVDWLYGYGRFAVQIFFVLGGYCLALGRTARRPPTGLREAVRLVFDRYLRIGLPYLLALGIAVMANEVAAMYMHHPSISPRPTPWQLVAHVLLIHKVLGYDSLTAGIWYVAIDLQLVALVGLVYAMGARLSSRHGPLLARWTLLGLGLVSVFWWNRVPRLDCFAIYFLFSYVLGMGVAWVKHGTLPAAAFWAYLGATALALQVDFRQRLVVVIVTAAVLALAQGQRRLTGLASPRPLRMLADMSYSLFLIHFPTCLVVNAWWSRHVRADPWLALLGMGMAWILSLAAAFLFHHLVEKRLSDLRPAGSRIRHRGSPDRAGLVFPPAGRAALFKPRSLQPRPLGGGDASLDAGLVCLAKPASRDAKGVTVTGFTRAALEDEGSPVALRTMPGRLPYRRAP